MMNKARKWIAFMVIAGLLLSGPTALAAAEPTTIMGKSMMHFVVDGTEYAPPEGETGGFFYENNGTHTYVPLRFVAYILKKDVSWDNKEKRVSINNPNSEEALAQIEAYLEQHRVADSAIEPVGPVNAETLNIEVMEEVRYVFNGKQVAAGEHTPGLLIDNRLYVPMRFITESLGYGVKWEQTTYTISVEIADVDRIVGHYQQLADIKKEQLIAEALGILQDLGINSLLDVTLGRASEEQMAQLREIGKDMLPEVEQQMNDLLAAMDGELTELNQPTVHVDELRKQLEGLLNLVRNYLADEGVDS